MKFVVEDAFSRSSVSWTDEELGSWIVTFTWQERGDRVDAVGIDMHAVDPASARITAVLLRRVPVGQLLELARAQRFDEAGGHDVEGMAAVDGLEQVAEQVADEAGVWRVRRPGRKPQYDEAHYQEVARVYDEELRSGKHRPAPVLAVLQAFSGTAGDGPSLDTAQRWVDEARRRRFLPPTTQGRARGNPAQGD